MDLDLGVKGGGGYLFESVFIEGFVFEGNLKLLAVPFGNLQIYVEFALGDSETG